MTDAKLQKRLAALDRDYYSRLLMVVGWYFEQRQQIQQGDAMTWQIIVSGHNGTDEYGSDEYKATEVALAARGEEFALTLRDDGATHVRFAGNFVNRESSLVADDPATE